MDTHRVSVIIPMFNRAFCLARSIGSVLAQSYINIEIIIVDDASTDNSFDVIQPYLKDPRVRYVKLESNKGAQVARNIGIKNARGDYIAFLDSDDEWFPDSLEVRLAALRKNGAGRALVYGDIINMVNGLEIPHQFKRLNEYSYPYLLKELSLCPPSTVLITKECFEVAGYNEEGFARGTTT